MTQHHNFRLTMRTLKGVLKKLNLNRKRNIDDSGLKQVIEVELETSARIYGYREMTEHLSIKFNINTSKESVRKCLKLAGSDWG